VRDTLVRVRSIRDTFVGVALVAVLVYFLPMRRYPIRTGDGLFEYLITVFFLAIAAGFALGFVSRWWQLWCARHYEARVGRFFQRDSLVYTGLIMVVVALFLLLLRWIYSVDYIPTRISAFEVIMALISLPIVLFLAGVFLVTYIIAWIGAILIPLGLLMGLAIIAGGFTIGGTLYTGFEYLRIFFSRQPLEDVLISYGRLTTDQVRERLLLAVRKARDFNNASFWELEKQTRISAELADKLRADKVLIDSLIEKARAEHMLNLYQSVATDEQGA
jgi:hypothetical protein